MSSAIGGEAGRGLLRKAEEAGPSEEEAAVRDPTPTRAAAAAAAAKLHPPSEGPSAGRRAWPPAPAYHSYRHHHTHSRRLPRPPPLPPGARFTQAGLFGAFTDPAVEAAFWAARTPGLRSRDAAACWLFGAFMLGGILSHRPNFAPAALPLAAAIAGASGVIGWRVRRSAGPRRPAALRLAAVLGTAFLVTLHSTDAQWAFLVAPGGGGGRGGGGGGGGGGGESPTPTPRGWRAPPPHTSSPAVLLRAPAITALAALTLACDGPPLQHALTSALSVAVCLLNMARVMRMRVAMHGLGPHTAAAGALSSATHALLRPHEDGPRAMHPSRAVLWLTLGLYCCLGYALPSHALWASHRVARRRFRERWEPVFGQGGRVGDGGGDVVPRVRRRGPALRRTMGDSVLLDAAIQVGLVLVLWAAAEEVDGWWGVEEGGGEGADTPRVPRPAQCRRSAVTVGGAL